MRKKEFTKEQLDDIIDLYVNQHISLASIGKRYNVSRTVITRVVKENNIEIRKDNHTYYADYNKFERIDSAEKAYWLGFLAADGCVYVREDLSNATVLINIHQKDRELLEKFNSFMKSNNPIKNIIQNEGYSNNTPMCRLAFNSKKMAFDLIDKGVVQRKSLILEPPKIDEQYELPFILGYFDGDGSIYKTKQNEWGISIEGTKEILEWINKILKISDVLSKRYDDDKNNYYIRCGGINKPYQIMKKLYDSVDVHLERKYNIYNELETVVLSRNIKNY